MTESPDRLLKKVQGCLYGGAIGDAMGAPAEWRMPDEIQARYGYITDLVEAWDAANTRGRGHGRYTDDTHMVQLLCECYIECGDHLDAHEFFRRIVPKMALEERWIPEREREMPLVERLFYPEKWLYNRWLANADPRYAGVGNMVNCGAAMYAAPVGIINACDPTRAYAEAVDIFSAHQYSFGLEAAAVQAACVAEAFSPEASVASIIDAALTVAKDGTADCIAAIADKASTLSDWREAIVPLRDIMREYDTSPDDAKSQRGNGSNSWNAQPRTRHRRSADRARLSGRHRRRLRADYLRRDELRPRQRLDRRHGRGDRRRPAWHRRPAPRVGGADQQRE